MIVILLDSVKNQLNLVAFGGWFFCGFALPKVARFRLFFVCLLLIFFSKKRTFVRRRLQPTPNEDRNAFYST